MSQHYTTFVSFPVVAVPAGLCDLEDMQFGAQIVVRYYAGRPATMYQRNGDPGDPAEDPEIELLKILKIRDENGKPGPWRVPVKPDDLTIITALEAWADSDEGAYAMMKRCRHMDDYLRDEAADARREMAAEYRAFGTDEE